MRSLRVRFLSKCVLWIFFIILGLSALGKSNGSELDSLQTLLRNKSMNDSSYAMTCWYLAKYYDDHNQFDSMQRWINAGVAHLPVNKNQLIHFHYAAFQSIAYYYNGLLQMDLYESMKVLRIAQEIQDSILLTTGYNFMGLANSNIGDYQKAIPYFYQGMKYAKQPPFDPKYLVASKPHHLYGNLAEAYYKTQRYDSALHNAYQSLQLAREIKSKRGMAVAKNLLGLIYAKQQRYDSAFQYQTQAFEDGLAYGETDVSLIASSALAHIMQQQQQWQAMNTYLEKGFQLKEKYPNINYYFSKQFLDEALSIYTATQHTDGRLKCLELINLNNARINSVTDQQVVKIILDGIQNENRANRLALSESEQQRHVVTLRFILALIAFAATGLFLVLYFFYNKRRLKEISLRQEISRDLHDDMNSTLSSIKLYSELSVQEQEKNSSHAIHITHRITTLTADLMSRVSDVIYVLKSEHLEPDMLSKRIKSVVHDLLIAKDIQAIWKLDEGLLRHLHAPLQIKNILLIIKEAVHNVAKYSEAKTCTLKLYQQNQQVYLEIQDDGIGMPEGSKTKGNGLQNMQFRCDQMQAEFSIQSKPNEGTCVRCIFPLSIFR